MKIQFATLALLVATIHGYSQQATTEGAKQFSMVVTPFLQQYCAECHAGKSLKGDFSVETTKLTNDFTDAATKAKWREVVNVLNSHEMPPKKSVQPTAKEVAAVVDWITAQAVAAELSQREAEVVLRRLNREEYRNTIRDLLGIDYDTSYFPEDPLAGGFDNNGKALTMSPLQLETYFRAAREVLDRAIVTGERPKAIRWKFEPTVGDMDRRRVKVDEQNRSVIVNGGNNTQQGTWVRIHHDSWDKGIGARNFRVPVAGEYIIRIKAASIIPKRDEVVASAKEILDARRIEQDKKNPKGAKYTLQQMQNDLKHFETDRMYDYGPARLKMTVQLGPQPKTIAEFDCDGTLEKPKVHEIRTRFTTESAGISLHYAYSIPRELENFWLQNRLARPELLVEWFELEGPIYDAWPPSSHTKLLGTIDQSNEDNHASKVLTQFMRKAFRRPVTADEVARKHRLYLNAKAAGADFHSAIKEAFAAVLTSPHFLYLVETTETPQQDQLNAHQLAARMSYFLWSSMPDDELNRLADNGKILDPNVRLEQLARMLADPKNSAFVQNFAGQWLALREVGKNPPAPDLYPRYDRHLEVSMIQESEEFFKEILKNHRPLSDFIDSDYVVINERLARYYGIPNVSGDYFRKVAVPPEVHRGGIVTQASILTVTSNGTRTSPVKRGTWILKTLLGIDPGLPVANAGEIAPKVPGIDKATVRKRLEIHRELDQCARCHNKIDPLGFSLENFNAAGEWRDREGFGYKGRIGSNDPLIDASAEMIDGTKFVGVAGLQQVMLRDKKLFYRCLATKLLTYALGREPGLADQPTISVLVEKLEKEPATLNTLLQAIVTSTAFGRK
ncbi:MAG: DUF1592 domain-containing protein [Zavarzinella sp.]